MVFRQGKLNQIDVKRNAFKAKYLKNFEMG